MCVHVCYHVMIQPSMCVLSFHVCAILPCVCYPSMCVLSFHVCAIIPCVCYPSMCVLSSFHVCPCVLSCDDTAFHVCAILPCVCYPSMCVLSFHVCAILPCVSMCVHVMIQPSMCVLYSFNAETKLLNILYIFILCYTVLYSESTFYSIIL